MADENLIKQFADKYKSGSDWGGHSGGGSVPYFALPYRAFLEQFVYMNGFSRIVDIGCGDWQFSRFVNFYPAKYLGYDIIASVIDKNRANFSSEYIRFELMPNDINSVEDGDLLIIKDVLQHLSDEMIMEFKEKVFPKFRFCLLTNSFQKLNSQHNVNIEIGQFRSLDLKRPPYSFQGSYVVSYMSPLWEEIRTLLICRD